MRSRVLIVVHFQQKIDVITALSARVVYPGVYFLIADCVMLTTIIFIHLRVAELTKLQYASTILFGQQCRWSIL